MSTIWKRKALVRQCLVVEGTMIDPPTSPHNEILHHFGKQRSSISTFAVIGNRRVKHLEAVLRHKLT